MILCNTQYFRGVDTIYTVQYAVFSGSGYYLYYAIRSIFEGGYYLYHAIRSILYITQCFRGVDTIYTVKYAEFSDAGYY